MGEMQNSNHSENKIDFEAAFVEEEFRISDYKIEDYLTFFIFWILIFVVFTQFFTRYILGNSTTWTEEIARYLLIMIGFMGSVMAVRRKSHIMVEFLYSYLSHKTVLILKFIVGMLSLSFYFMLAWISFRLAGRTMGMMVSIDVPKKLIYYFVFISFVLMAVRLLQEILRKITDSIRGVI